MPNGTLTYRRGEIWRVDLKPVIGNETDKERPCLILQNDLGNQTGATTIVAPLLPGTKNKQGLLEDKYWEEIEKAVCIELGFSLYSKRYN